MYECKCGREFENKQSYVAHCGHCEVHLGHPPKDRFGDSRAWARGKTKETDPRIERISRTFSENHQGENGTFYGKCHNEQTKAIMAKNARYNAKNHLNGWKAGDNRIPNQYEKFTENFLIAHNIVYRKEVPIKKSFFVEKLVGYYRLDFLINETIDLEIDGSSHNIEVDNVRDDIVSKKYTVYRIQHNDSFKILEEKLVQFIETLR